MNQTSFLAREVVNNRHHPVVQQVRALHTRPERERTRLFLCEGVRFVAHALQGGFEMERLVYAPDLLAHKFGRNFIRQQEARGVPCLPVTSEVFQFLAQGDETQGVLGVFKQRWTSLADTDPTEGLCWVALDTVRSSGNLGTMLRTGEAVGVAGFILLSEAIDPYDPTCVRASMAALLSTRIARAKPAQFLRWKKRHGCLLVGTSPAATRSYDALPYPTPTVLLMGGERKGLSDIQQERCDAMVKLPMRGKSDSLNLSIATGIMLYEVLRQRNGGALTPQPAAPDG